MTLSLVPPSSHPRILETRRPATRLERLYSEALLRRAACSLCGEEILAAPISRTEQGKPYFPDFPALQFSISHTDGQIAVLIADVPVGVDVESIHPVRRVVAERFFTPAECAWIRASENEWEKRFFTIWTRKEAYGKFRGTGLSYPTRTVDVCADRQDARFHTRVLNGCVLSLCVPSALENPSAVPCSTWCLRAESGGAPVCDDAYSKEIC